MPHYCAGISLTLVTKLGNKNDLEGHASVQELIRTL